MVLVDYQDEGEGVRTWGDYSTLLWIEGRLLLMFYQSLFIFPSNGVLTAVDQALRA